MYSYSASLTPYFCALQALFLIANFSIFKSLLNPAVLNACVWFIFPFIHLTLNHNLIPISDFASFIIFSSSIVFTLGVITAKKIHSPNPAKPMQPSKNLISFFGGVSALCVVPYYLRARELASHGTTGSFMVDLRISLNNPNFNESFGLLAYAGPISFAAFFLTIANESIRIRSWLFFGTLVLAVFYAGISTGRTFIFMLLITSVSLLYFRRPQYFTVKLGVFAVVLLAGIFWIVGTLMGKLGDGNISSAEVIHVYLLGGLSAFSSSLENLSNYTYGSNSFRIFFAVAGRIGFDVPITDLVKGYAYIPYPTNVYTVFMPYIEDFGVLYLLISLGLISFFIGLLYYNAINGHTRSAVMYSLFCYAILTQWFQDQFASLATTWIIFFLLVSASLIRLKR